MTKLDIAISSIKYSIEVSDEEVESFKKLAKSLNSKTNELMMKTGKISDRLLLFVVFLIALNRREKVFNNFEDNLIKLLKKGAPVLNGGDDLDSQLIMASILMENATSGMPSEGGEVVESEDVRKILDGHKKTNEETIKFIDEIINFVEKLANNINKM